MTLNNRQMEAYASNDEFIIAPIINEDRDYYVKLHKELEGEKTLYLNPVCKDMMWEATLQGKDKIYSIFDKNAEYCGSVELQNSHTKTPEIGIDLLVCKRNQGIAPKIIKMFAKRTYEMLDVEYFLIHISSQNTHSKHVFEKMGVIPIGEEESRYKSFMKYLKGVVGNQDLSIVEPGLEEYFDKSDKEEVIYRYKLGPEVFLCK